MERPTGTFNVGPYETLFVKLSSRLRGRDTGVWSKHGDGTYERVPEPGPGRGGSPRVGPWRVSLGGPDSSPDRVSVGRR